VWQLLLYSIFPTHIEVTCRKNIKYKTSPRVISDMWTRYENVRIAKRCNFEPGFQKIMTQNKYILQGAVRNDLRSSNLAKRYHSSVKIKCSLLYSLSGRPHATSHDSLWLVSETEAWEWQAYVYSWHLKKKILIPTEELFHTHCMYKKDDDVSSSWPPLDCDEYLYKSLRSPGEIQKVT
jgi:hypothetical protein